MLDFLTRSGRISIKMTYWIGLESLVLRYSEAIREQVEANPKGVWSWLDQVAIAMRFKVASNRQGPLETR